MSTLPPIRELVNVYEVQSAARAVLPPALFAELAGEDRRALDRITLRPRLMQDVTALDLSVDLFGQKHFTPILIGPVEGLERFHPQAASELAKGAAAAKAIQWPAVAPDAAPPAGARVLLLRGWQWPQIDRLRKQTQAALVLKGVLNAEDAREAVARGLDGLVVSGYGVPEAVSSIAALPAVVDAVAGRVPVLADGGFRRGTDIAKALALGARAVMVTRPVLWGLSAYGAEGVQHVVELLQSELARALAMLGKASPAQLDRSAIRLHRW